MSKRQISILGILFITVVALLACLGFMIISTVPIIPVPTSTTAFQAFIRFDVDLSSKDKANINGKTNLPDGTIIMVSVEGISKKFLGQQRVTVKNGNFTAGPFSPDGGLESGKYKAEALMPFAIVQPEHVKRIIGERGERLVGSQVTEGEEGRLIVEEEYFEIVPPPPQHIELSGPDIGKRKVEQFGKYALTLNKAWKTDKSYDIEPLGYDASIGKETHILVIVDIEIENLLNEPQTFYSRFFNLYVLEDLKDAQRFEGLGTDIFYPKAFNAGYFHILHLNPKERFHGYIAYDLPIEARTFVLSESGCPFYDKNSGCEAELQEGAAFRFGH